MVNQWFEVIPTRLNSLSICGNSLLNLDTKWHGKLIPDTALIDDNDVSGDATDGWNQAGNRMAYACACSRLPYEKLPLNSSTLWSQSSCLEFDGQLPVQDDSR